MSWDKVIGPASVIYMVASLVAALWWASDINTRMAAVEQSTVTDGRIARLEEKMLSLADSNRELKESVNRLVIEIRRN